jgi:hypothetical protein
MKGAELAEPRLAGPKLRLFTISRTGSDGSQFMTSVACNPTLTIVTLAIRQADYIGGSFRCECQRLFTIAQRLVPAACPANMQMSFSP